MFLFGLLIREIIEVADTIKTWFKLKLLGDRKKHTGEE